MAVLVKIPTQLRAVAGGEAEAEVDGATVREVPASHAVYVSKPGSVADIIEAAAAA